MRLEIARLRYELPFYFGGVFSPGRFMTASVGFLEAAFKAIAEQHHFPPDFPSPDIAAGLLNSILSRADVYSVIAEVDGRIVGSNLLWENAAIVQPMTLMSQGLYQKPYGAFLPSLLY